MDTERTAAELRVQKDHLAKMRLGCRVLLFLLKHSGTIVLFAHAATSLLTRLLPLLRKLLP